MDDMRDRRSQSNSRRLRHQNVKNYEHQLKQSFARYGAFFKVHKQSILAIALLAILTLLLFGIFSRLEAPITYLPTLSFTMNLYSLLEMSECPGSERNLLPRRKSISNTKETTIMQDPDELQFLQECI